MTPRQRQLLDYIHGYMADHGYQPTYIEMARALALKSKSGIHRLLNTLHRDGHIERRRNARRGISLIDGSAEDIATASSAALAGELKRRGYTIVPPLTPSAVEGSAVEGREGCEP